MPPVDHIGIVACSAEGAALCYRIVCGLGAGMLGGHAHPQVSMHTHSLQEYVERLDAGDRRGVALLMLDSANRLARAGAGFLICPDNTIHQAFDLMLPESPLPWLHIAEVVAAEARRRGFRKVGILGTRWLVDSEVYPEKFAACGIDSLRPIERDRETVGRIIMDELVFANFKPESVRRLLEVIVRLRESGCDAVVLGCTELPLVLDETNSPLPVLDSTALLARAAVLRALGRDPAGDGIR